MSWGLGSESNVVKETDIVMSSKFFEMSEAEDEQIEAVFSYGDLEEEHLK